MEAGLDLALGFYLLVSHHASPGSSLQSLLLFGHALLSFFQILVNVEQLPQEVGAFQLLLYITVRRAD